MEVPETASPSVRNTWYTHLEATFDLPGIAGGKQKNTIVTTAKMAAKALTNAIREMSE
jgi:hypothetical protein